MKQRKLVSSILVGLCTTFAMAALHAQDSSTTPQDQATTDQAKKKQEQTFDTVTVTGSLIPRAQIETASPIITITAQDIQKQGFKNVYDALHSLPVASGQIQDNQSTNSFTPGANTISLLGLDPSFTLVLMNGRPLADYPFLYNSQSNFVDLNTIPTYLVDHVDVLTGNQSAIYGSSAIAGVINIVTKQKLEGVTLDYRVGGYSDGGGAQQRLQIAGGHSWGKLDFLFGFELSQQDAIRGYQRSYTDSAADNPTTPIPVPRRDYAIIDAFTGKYDDPGKATCDALSNLYFGDEAYRFRSGLGYYCGSNTAYGLGTFLNAEKSANGFASLKYQINDEIQVYVDGMFDVRKVAYATAGTQVWDSPPLYDIDDGYLANTIQRYTAPEEIGDLADAHLLERSYAVTLGVRGAIGSSNWNFDAYYHRSGYEADSKDRRLLESKAEAFYLGPQDGTDPYGYGYPAYHIRQAHFFSEITPAQYISITDIDRSDSSTYSQVGNFTLTNADLFEMPAGAAGVAAVLEVGNQYWDNPVDPRVTAGEFFGSGGTSGHGTRDREAAALEINIPIFKMLTFDGSARYDRYSTSDLSQGKVTYKAGLEFRPFDSLLLRASDSTAFRAPDMGFVFSGGSLSFVQTPDYYNCRRAKGDDFNCSPSYLVEFPLKTDPNHDLKYITAKSFGYGVVWSPSSSFNITADYYHIKLNNEVASYSPDTLLRREADCRLGHDANGVAVDINSQICQQTIAAIQRVPIDATLGAGTLLGVTNQYLNLANEMVSGLVMSTKYKIDAGRFGDILVGADYNTTFKHVLQEFVTDPVDDLLRDHSYYGPYKNIFSAYVEWNVGPWSTTFHGQRYGSTFSNNLEFAVAPWMIYNASVQYNFNEDAAVTLIGNNIFNSRPPIDNSFGTYPYYNPFNYNSYDRLVMAEFNVHFGGGKK